MWEHPKFFKLNLTIKSIFMQQTETSEKLICVQARNEKALITNYLTIHNYLLKSKSLVYFFFT